MSTMFGAIFQTIALVFKSTPKLLDSFINHFYINHKNKHYDYIKGG